MKLCIKTDTIRGFVRIVEGMVDNLYKEIEDWLKPKFIESNGGMRSHKSKKIVEAVKKGACDGDSIEHCESFDAKKTSVKDRLDEIDRKIASQETSIDLLSELIAARAPVSDLDTLKSGCIELTERIEKLESTVEKNKR